jgi:hypothetical protein
LKKTSSRTGTTRATRSPRTTRTRAPRPPASHQPFASGQIFALDGSRIEIGMVGKRLVHYKHFQGTLQRAPISLATKESLDEFLLERNAVLKRG